MSHARVCHSLECTVPQLAQFFRFHPALSHAARLSCCLSVDRGEMLRRLPPYETQNALGCATHLTWPAFSMGCLCGRMHAAADCQNCACALVTRVCRVRQLHASFTRSVADRCCNTCLSSTGCKPESRRAQTRSSCSGSTAPVARTHMP